MLACYEAEVAELARAPAGALLYPGVLHGLATLRRHYKLCVVSNCQSGYLEGFLKHSGAAGFLDDSECIGRTGEPKAVNIRLLCARQNLQSPILVGDTERDEAAAQDAGVPFIHAAYGFGTASPGTSAVASFSELVELLLSGRQRVPGLHA
jgi:phosphoglycolate phosphatase